MPALREGDLLITGASRGIGQRIAWDLASPRHHLILTARDPEGLAATVSGVEARGGTAEVLVGDVTDHAHEDAILSRLEKASSVAGVVLNAGIEHTCAIEDQTAAQVRQQVEVNLLAPLQLTRRLVPMLRQQGYGAICLISSMSGKAPTPWNAVYTATKHGLVGFAASVRIELAGSGVTIGTVCPSFVAEAGMWHSFGLQAPPMLREVPMDRVLSGVRDVLNGKGEVLASPGPVRLLLALSALFPGLDQPVLRTMGVLDVLKQRALAARQGDQDAS